MLVEKEDAGFLIELWNDRLEEVLAHSFNDHSHCDGSECPHVPNSKVQKARENDLVTCLAEQKEVLRRTKLYFSPEKLRQLVHEGVGNPGTNRNESLNSKYAQHCPKHLKMSATLYTIGIRMAASVVNELALSKLSPDHVFPLVPDMTTTAVEKHIGLAAGSLQLSQGGMAWYLRDLESRRDASIAAATDERKAMKAARRKNQRHGNNLLAKPLAGGGGGGVTYIGKGRGVKPATAKGGGSYRKVLPKKRMDEIRKGAQGSTSTGRKGKRGKAEAQVELQRLAKLAALEFPDAPLEVHIPQGKELKDTTVTAVNGIIGLVENWLDRLRSKGESHPPKIHSPNRGGNRHPNDATPKGSQSKLTPTSSDTTPNLKSAVRPKRKRAGQPSNRESSEPSSTPAPPPVGAPSSWPSGQAKRPRKETK
jgi:hypothetical protein